MAGSGGWRVDPKIVLVMLFNFCSSTGIIMVNKLLFGTYGFPFATFTTACHFIFTFIGVYICKLCGFFSPKVLSHWNVLSITLFFVGFVVFNNLSLNYNSVGFYQLMKVMTTPVIASIEYFVYGKDLHWKLKLALLPICIGVIMATVTDLSFNFTGLIFAILGILSTSYYQIFVKKKQKELKADSFQILNYQAPQAALITLLLTPMLDPHISPGKITELVEQPDPNQFATLICLFLSCCLAFCVNLSIFLVIGKTSPISYNVLGHAKLIVILTYGIFLFGDSTSGIRLFGMFLAVVGIVSYTHIKITMQEEKKDPVIETEAVALKTNAQETRIEMQHLVEKSSDSSSL